MRTSEEIQKELNENGFVHLTAEESEQYVSGDSQHSVKTNFLSYSETVTQGDQSVEKTASATIPENIDSIPAMRMLKTIVQENDDACQASTDDWMKTSILSLLSLQSLSFLQVRVNIELHKRKAKY